MSVIKGVLLRFSRLVSCCSDSCEYVNRMNHDSVSMSESSSLFSRVLLIISGRLIRLTKFQIPYPKHKKPSVDILSHARQNVSARVFCVASSTSSVQRMIRTRYSIVRNFVRVINMLKP